MYYLKPGKTLFIAFILLSLNAIGKTVQVKTGNWHLEFNLSENHKLPVDVIIAKNFDALTIVNGTENIELHNIQRSEDSVFIHFDVFNSEFRAQILSKKEIRGNWYNHERKGNYFLPFTAKFNHGPRYPEMERLIDINGRWEVYFDYKAAPEKALGIFEFPDETNKVTGTFLTETGDYRYLDGAVLKDSFYLSTFDGSHAFLFYAVLRNDTLFGNFRSGKHYLTDWYAVKNPNFELANPDSLTYLINQDPITFELNDYQGNAFKFPEDNKKNTVTILQIMGTWCPNCWDESIYLKGLKDKYQDDLNIIAITFETPADEEGRRKKVASYRDNLNLDYTFLMGGSACKACASDLFPQLSEIISFPTMIILDKSGMVRKIHTGFSGPGTGIYYDEFVTHTNAFVDRLINE